MNAHLHLVREIIYLNLRF